MEHRHNKLYEIWYWREIEGDKKGANLARGIGSAGKLLFGAARQGLSGFANAKRNNYLSEFYANQSRTARQGQFTGQPQFRENQGGLPFKDGGQITDPPLNKTRQNQGFGIIMSTVTHKI